ncbi:sodium:calcium antiporter [Aquabacter spiritensis]|uniref:Cation:H+ antiporter n=1 Tax=Aquabacter spiritensis TaxID=933073 RepID=A0A4R3LPC9_9HYPH|nr:sodium:calcium antiporter [Aquabacter spiritensis]TCT01556.1 cation:H+ antiporter [Aquabacter spiritensis]
MQLTGLSLWVIVPIFLAAAAIVWGAGTRLTGYLDGIATLTGIGHAFAGMLLLGGITSLPEVASVATASVAGNAPLATNNLLGSVAINVVLIAFADVLMGREALTSVVPTSTTILQGALGMIALGILVLAILTGDVAIGWIGLWPVVLAAYCVFAFRLSSLYSKRRPWQAVKAAPLSPVRDEDLSGSSLQSLIAKTSLAGVAILIAGFFLALSGEAIAEKTGLGSGLVGLVLVGFATSLPEVSSIAAAVRLKRYEMALGDIFGTNLLTIGLLVMADGLYTEGPVLVHAGKFETIAALIGLLLTGIFLVGLIERGNRSVARLGYDSLAALCVFFAGLALLALTPAS